MEETKERSEAERALAGSGEGGEEGNMGLAYWHPTVVEFFDRITPVSYTHLTLPTIYSV